MRRPKLEEMTLREKLGQTGQPSAAVVRAGLEECGSYEAYIQKYPFGSIWISENMKRVDGTPFASPEELGNQVHSMSNAAKIPLLVTGDFEMGANSIFPCLHAAGSNMEMGASGNLDLIYKRAYYWARELRSFGVNNPYGPVTDICGNFFSPGAVRRISDDWKRIVEVQRALFKGIHDAGLAACMKHYPGPSDDYRDSHFSLCTVDKDVKQWYETYFNIYKSAVADGVMSVESSHHPWPSIDPRKARGNILRPATASKPVMDILRNEIGFNGVLYTDAVNMKAMSAAFEHEDVYIESFLAGHDVVIFVHNDYFDVMEKAYNEGRITMEQIDTAVTRVLDLKEKLGLFEGPLPLNPLTPEENADFDRVLYELAKSAQTLVTNANGAIPFDPKKIEKAAIITLSSMESFHRDIPVMTEQFAKYGIETTVVDKITSDSLAKLDAEHDLIIYACMIKTGFAAGMPFFDRPELRSLFHSMSYGAQKSVVVSFGHPSVYYNYFENCDMYINTYSADKWAMTAVVDGILGQFPLVGKSPVSLFPFHKQYEV